MKNLSAHGGTNRAGDTIRVVDNAGPPRHPTGPLTLLQGHAGRHSHPEPVTMAHAGGATRHQTHPKGNGLNHQHAHGKHALDAAKSDNC